MGKARNRLQDVWPALKFKILNLTQQCNLSSLLEAVTDDLVMHSGKRHNMSHHEQFYIVSKSLMTSLKSGDYSKKIQQDGLQLRRPGKLNYVRSSTVCLTLHMQMHWTWLQFPKNTAKEFISQWPQLAPNILEYAERNTDNVEVKLLMCKLANGGQGQGSLSPGRWTDRQTDGQLSPD